MEQWRTIEGHYPYQISSYGRVKGKQEYKGYKISYMEVV